MASPITQTFEGNPDGTVLSAANTAAGGDAIAGTTGTAGTSRTASTDHAHSGTCSFKNTYIGTTASYIFWNFATSAATVRSVYRTWYYVATGQPIASQYLIEVRSAAGSVAAVAVSSTGLLRLLTGTAAGQRAIETTANIPFDTWVRVELAITPGTTTSNGSAEFAYFSGDSTTPIYQSGVISGIDVGTVVTTQVRLGYSGTVTARIHYYDDFAAKELASGWIGTLNTPVTPKTLAISWAVRSRVTPKTLALAWAVRTAIVRALALSWAVRTAVTKTLALSWRVRSSVVKTLALTWAVRAAITRTLSLSWAVRATVTRTLTLSWAVRNVVAAKTLTATWAVRRAVVKTLPLTWAVRAAIVRTLVLAWSLRSSVTRTLALTWAVLSNRPSRNLKLTGVTTQRRWTGALGARRREGTVGARQWKGTL